VRDVRLPSVYRSQDAGFSDFRVEVAAVNFSAENTLVEMMELRDGEFRREQFEAIGLEEKSLPQSAERVRQDLRVIEWSFL
jgi:hypothetical protein